MLQKVVSTKKDYEESFYGKNRATLFLVWVCVLECGHTERRRRSTEPEKLKCYHCYDG